MRMYLTSLVVAVALVGPAWSQEKAAKKDTAKKQKAKAPTALQELNAARARRGLPPYKEDKKLTVAATRAAQYRAAHLIAGHADSDFKFLPQGAFAPVAGCGALDDSWGWATCCMYENWRYAGAAWVRGRDGKRYMHVFCR
jgi:hypothetical protein